METSEQAAIAQVRAGDSGAFQVLVERHSRNLFRLAWRMTGNREDAEDVVQETFLRAYRQLHRFDGRASFGTWLHRIAANHALDLMRARRLREPLRAPAGREDTDPLAAVPGTDPGPDRLAMSGQVQRKLAEAMDELSADERAAFVLRHFESMPSEDIGRALGVNRVTARQAVFRAVRKLRQSLEPLMGSAV
jgi:RNA polymerase sigma-70 factor (ECF subfamily)